MITNEERDTLIGIGGCKNQDDIDSLLGQFFNEKGLNLSCKYIRSALACMSHLWETKQLLNSKHNDPGFVVYSFIFDNMFLNDSKFISKRSECYSNITKHFKNVDNQRVDFILRNVNDDGDFISVEEKPSRKGVKSDIRKGRVLQRCMSKLQKTKVNSSLIMEQLEAITCQYEGLKLSAYATKFISDDHFISYLKGTFTILKDKSHCASFAVMLAGVLSR